MLAVEEAHLPRAAGIYCRLSHAPDGSVEKVERQEYDCRQLAARLGWGLSEQHIFIDNSRSAWRRDRVRPDWERMLRAVELGEIDGLLVYHGDRLIRQPFDLEKLISIADVRRGFRIASPSGTRNLDSPDDRFVLRIEAAQACREVDNIARRVARDRKALLAKGKRLGGGRYRPFGFGVDTGRTEWKVNRATGEEFEVPVVDWDQVRSDEAELIVACVERLLSGQSQGGVRRWLSSKCNTTAGNEWSASGFRAMMTSPRIAGLIEHGGRLYEARWPAIISPETREDVLAVFRNSREKHRKPKGRGRKHLLSGVGECGRCHSLLMSGTGQGRGGGNRRQVSPATQKWRRVYQCRDCGLARDVAYLDAYVEGHVLRLLNSPDFLSSVLSGSDDRSEVTSQITMLEARRTELEKEMESAAEDLSIDSALALRTLSRYQERLGELRAQLAASTEERLLARMAGISHEKWLTEPVDVRSTVVRMLFRVVILPVRKKGPGFDPASVRVIRRQHGEGGGDTS